MNENINLTKIPKTSVKNDGIYLIDVNNNIVKFIGNKTEKVQNIAYIGIVEGIKRLKVSINEFNIQLQNDNFNCDSINNYNRYIKYEQDALMDWNGKENTKHILIQNPALKYKLKEGEYIPSLGQLVFIWNHRNQVNEALKFIGYKPLSQNYTWSSTEFYSYLAWSLLLNNGVTYYCVGSKYVAFTIRAVGEF